MASLGRPPFRFRSRHKSSVGIVVVVVCERKCAFLSSFLHLNEAGRIRGRNEGRKATTVACFEFVGANCRALSSLPCYSTPAPPLPPVSSLTPFSTSPSGPLQPLIYLFPRVSRCRLDSFLCSSSPGCFPRRLPSISSGLTRSPDEISRRGHSAPRF